jgi:hypothetical protein
VIVKVLLTPAVPPVFLIPGDHGSPAEFLGRDVGAEAAKLGILLQFLPWDCVLMAADPKKTPKGHHGVNHSPAHLLNDQVVDRADAVTSWVVEGSAPS